MAAVAAKETGNGLIKNRWTEKLKAYYLLNWFNTDKFLYKNLPTTRNIGLSSSKIEFFNAPTSSGRLLYKLLSCRGFTI